jgi:hypothetical protein
MNLTRLLKTLAADSEGTSGKKRSNPSIDSIHKGLTTRISRRGYGADLRGSTKVKSKTNPRKTIRASLVARGARLDTHKYLTDKGFEHTGTRRRKNKIISTYAHPNGVHVKHSIVHRNVDGKTGESSIMKIYKRKVKE